MRISFALTLLLATVAAHSTRANTVDYIVAIVNDSVITYGEVEKYTGQAIETLRRTFGPEAFKERASRAMQDTLENLVERQLILDEFKTLGGRIPDSMIEDEIKEHIRQNYIDRAKMTKTLKAQGISSEAFRKQVHDDFVLRWMRQKNVSSAILISPQKIEQYYQANLSEFQVSDQVKLRMIVLNKPPNGSIDDLRKLGLEIIRKMEEGATFAEMAAVYSEGSARRDEGDWGWVGTNRLNRGLSEVAFSLGKAQRSGLLALARDGADAYWIFQYDKEGNPASGRKSSDRGELLAEAPTPKSDVPKEGGEGANGFTLPAQPLEFYLMYVDDRRPARTRSLAEVREEIEKTLTNQERARLHKKWIERLKDKAFVRYF